MKKDKQEKLQDSLGIGTKESELIQKILSNKKMLLLGLAVCIILLLIFGFSGNKDKLKYITENAVKGDITVKISATGNLQPTIQVDVGSELSGTVEEVLVNDNDRVVKDQVLAKLDTDKLEDQVVKSDASLKSAESAVKLNDATVFETETNLKRLQETYKISGGKVPSKNDLTAAEAAYDRAVANLASATAAVAQAEASLRSDKTNLEKAVIKSPIDGIVLLRKVEPGQTVAASLQAPVLFVIAETLTQMELQVAIDEADVGLVNEGQMAEFTVDAYPERTFPAKITRVRYGSEVTNNVVTYQGVLQVENDDLSLRPGMTATANITTYQNKNMLLIPNAALRYNPATVTANSEGSSSVVSALIQRRPRFDREKTLEVVSKSGSQTIWVLRNNKPQEITIKAGNSDGKFTEVLEGDLKEGDAVITDAMARQE